MLVWFKLAALDKRRREGADLLQIGANRVARELGMNEDEVVVAFSELEKRLLLHGDGSKRPDRLRLRAFLLQVPTPFSVQLNPSVRGLGLRTGPSAPRLAEHLEAVEEHVMALPPERAPEWATTVEGILVPPIDPRAPEAAANDRALYELLTLFDTLRVLGVQGGQSRALAYARSSIEEFLSR